VFFINTSSLGSYPAYVAARERRERRWGKGPASTLAVLEILRTEKPLRAVLDGRECLVATMFVGNCRYQPSGFVPIWRQRLDDGRLDLRLLEAGHRMAATRLVVSFLMGRLGRSRLYREYDPVQLHVLLPDESSPLARDGELGPGVHEVHYGKQTRALTVYVAPHKVGRRRVNRQSDSATTRPGVPRSEIDRSARSCPGPRPSRARRMPRQASAEAVKFPRANRRSRWSSV